MSGPQKQRSAAIPGTCCNGLRAYRLAVTDYGVMIEDIARQLKRREPSHDARAHGYDFREPRTADAMTTLCYCGRYQLMISLTKL